MPTSAAIKLSKAEAPITAPVTKFGGEPCWLETPQWPISRELGIPMAFIGQVVLADVPSLPQDLRESGRIAYIFMTEDFEGGEVVPSWESEGGENSVIIQPNGGPVLAKTRALTINPEGNYPECAVQQTLQDEPMIVDLASNDPGFAEYGNDLLRNLLDVNKLGGVPCFIQYVEYPPNGPWLFILQLHEYHKLSGGIDFNPNFGMGQAHVFISEDGRTGRMLWQC